MTLMILESLMNWDKSHKTHKPVSEMWRYCYVIYVTLVLFPEIV